MSRPRAPFAAVLVMWMVAVVDGRCGDEDDFDEIVPVRAETTQHASFDFDLCPFLEEANDPAQEPAPPKGAQHAKGQPTDDQCGSRVPGTIETPEEWRVRYPINAMGRSASTRYPFIPALTCARDQDSEAADYHFGPRDLACEACVRFMRERSDRPPARKEIKPNGSKDKLKCIENAGKYVLDVCKDIGKKMDLEEALLKKKVAHYKDENFDSPDLSPDVLTLVQWYSELPEKRVQTLKSKILSMCHVIGSELLVVQPEGNDRAINYEKQFSEITAPSPPESMCVLGGCCSISGGMFAGPNDLQQMRPDPIEPDALTEKIENGGGEAVYAVGHEVECAATVGQLKVRVETTIEALLKQTGGEQEDNDVDEPSTLVHTRRYRLDYRKADFDVMGGDGQHDEAEDAVKNVPRAEDSEATETAEDIAKEEAEEAARVKAATVREQLATILAEFRNEAFKAPPPERDEAGESGAELLKGVGGGPTHMPDLAYDAPAPPDLGSQPYPGELFPARWDGRADQRTVEALTSLSDSAVDQLVNALLYPATRAARQSWQKRTDVLLAAYESANVGVEKGIKKGKERLPREAVSVVDVDPCQEGGPTLPDGAAVPPPGLLTIQLASVGGVVDIRSKWSALVPWESRAKDEIEAYGRRVNKDMPSPYVPMEVEWTPFLGRQTEWQMVTPANRLTTTLSVHRALSGMTVPSAIFEQLFVESGEPDVMVAPEAVMPVRRAEDLLGEGAEEASYPQPLEEGYRPIEWQKAQRPPKHPQQWVE